MTMTEVFEELITALQPSNVPIPYILRAHYVDKTGMEHTIFGDEDLEHFMKNPQKYNVLEARIYLNVEKIQKLFWMNVVSFFNELKLQVNELEETTKSLPTA